HPVPSPPVVPAVVMDTYRPELFCCRIFAAPISLWIAAEFSYSGSSRSKSTALSPYLVITAWYALAVDCGSPHTWPSLVPPYPPKETDTSPPALRTALMTELAVVSELMSWVPSQAAEQPPPDRMNASSK